MVERRRRGDVGIGVALGGGAPATPAAYVGTKAAQLDGVDEYLRCATPVATPSTDFSVSLWLYVGAASGTGRYVEQYTSASNLWNFRRNGANVQFVWATSISINRTHTETVGQWVHFVAVCTGSSGARQIDLYRNGVGLTTTGAGTILANSGAVSVGCSGTTTLFANARVCDVAIWSQALTSGNVTSLYNGGARLDPRTVAGGPAQLWAFQATDDMTGTTGSIADLIGGNPLVPTNTESGDLVDGPP